MNRIINNVVLYIRKRFFIADDMLVIVWLPRKKRVVFSGYSMLVLIQCLSKIFISLASYLSIWLKLAVECADIRRNTGGEGGSLGRY